MQRRKTWGRRHHTRARNPLNRPLTCQLVSSQGHEHSADKRITKLRINCEAQISEDNEKLDENLSVCF